MFQHYKNSDYKKCGREGMASILIVSSLVRICTDMPEDGLSEGQNM